MKVQIKCQKKWSTLNPDWFESRMKDFLSSPGGFYSWLQPVAKTIPIQAFSFNGLSMRPYFIRNSFLSTSFYLQVFTKKNLQEVLPKSTSEVTSFSTGTEVKYFRVALCLKPSFRLRNTNYKQLQHLLIRKRLSRAKGKVWNPSSRMESVYRAYFHANTSSLTYHYLVRALRIVFFLLLAFAQFTNSAQQGPKHKHRNGFSQSQATPYDERKGERGRVTCRSVIKQNYT